MVVWDDACDVPLGPVVDRSTDIPLDIAVVDVISVELPNADFDGVAYVDDILPFNEMPVPSVPAVCANLTFDISLNVPANFT